jgi:hypothetical protein
MAANTHVFNVQLATDLGSVNDAIILQHFFYWHQNNQNKPDRIKGDHPYPWTFSTIEDMLNIFPYMKKSAIGNSIIRLIDAGLIIKGNWNKLAFDKTAWYALTEKGLIMMHGGVSRNEKSGSRNEKSGSRNENSSSRNENTIPDSNPDSNPDSKNNNNWFKDLKAGTILDDSFRRPTDMSDDEFKVLQLDI